MGKIKAVNVVDVCAVCRVLALYLRKSKGAVG